ncbi:MAG TPA: hypothetical protein VGE74_06905 [Gemmata sp.]
MLTPIRTDGLVLVPEPLEGAFTLLMPAGWTNDAQLQREHALNRIIASAVRPDKGALIYLGDPRLPIFMEPSPYIDPGLMLFSPQMRLQPYTPADRFFGDYVHQCFGRAPGFQVAAVTHSPEAERTVPTRRPGSVLTSVQVTFRHVFHGKPMQCRLYGLVHGWSGMWTVDVATVSAEGELDAHCRVALRMMTSRAFDPRWEATQQQLHEHRMALGRQQLRFTESMTRLQQQGHEQRMRDIQSAGAVNTRIHEERTGQGDAAHQAWVSRQVADDAAQRARVNAIREEHTVAGADGTTYQVDARHERYFVNKRDNTYIGTGATVGQNDLRRHYGVNPDEYEEVKIVR